MRFLLLLLLLVLVVVVVLLLLLLVVLLLVLLLLLLAPRIPARGYHALLANITSYSTILMALFGNKCGHYKGVQVLLELMRGLFDKQSYFTHQYCKEITFAILDDSRRFFSNYITPDKFNMGI